MCPLCFFSLFDYGKNKPDAVLHFSANADDLIWFSLKCGCRVGWDGEKHGPVNSRCCLKWLISKVWFIVSIRGPLMKAQLNQIRAPQKRRSKSDTGARRRTRQDQDRTAQCRTRPGQGRETEGKGRGTTRRSMRAEPSTYK